MPRGSGREQHAGRSQDRGVGARSLSSSPWPPTGARTRPTRSTRCSSWRSRRCSSSWSIRDAGGAPGTAPETGYMDDVVRAGVIATAFWGVVGFLAGTYIAFELAFPVLNWGLPWTSFGRLRPLHTSAVIFAFGGNALIATSFYVVQRTCATRLWGGNAAWFVFWGYNLFIVLAATGYVLGSTQSQGIRRAGMVRRPLADHRLGGLSRGLPRHDRQAQGTPHLRGELVLPQLHRDHRDAARRSTTSRSRCRSGASQSVILFPGVQGAMVQWWYGHNAVGFFLTAGFLGMMYYFIPKQARPPGLLLQALDHPLLVADLPLHLGRPAPPALHRAARLGADPRHGLLDRPLDAVLGRDDQRPDDAAGRLGQAPHRPDPADARGRRSASTAWRPSRGR